MVKLNIIKSDIKYQKQKIIIQKIKLFKLIKIINLNKIWLNLTKIKLRQKLKKRQIYIKKYKLLGSGLTATIYLNKLIINLHQSHWYIINLNKNAGALIIKKRANYIFSTKKNRLKKILYILSKLKKFNYYKEKGIIEKLKIKQKKILLKKNEQKSFI